METGMRVIRFLKRASSKGIPFKKNNHLNLLAYTNAYLIGDRDGRKIYITFVGANSVMWKGKKQKIIVLSSAEAKFRGIA